MPDFSVEDIAERFPEFQVAFLIAEPLSVIGRECGATCLIEVLRRDRPRAEF